ncbi:unnamed protein product [Nesidiocoris tenuis]|uniref:V-type proton ATPase subunit n=1 Tax=Nesidiocoris tenuis TaxID=355587 RepID=A0A6H5GJC6_9HEMI|nr:unnamed protein product [Nesidiocoris tenuis]
MAVAWIFCSLVTLFWAAIGIVVPIFLPKRPNRGVFQLALILTAVTCWLFWLITYMTQMNPLIGPKLNKLTLLAVAQQWVRNHNKICH